MPEESLYHSMLLDCYGEILTARQRECCELHFNEDLSLSEIAEHCGISRQAVWDNIRRATDAMERLESKTGLLRRTRQSETALRAALNDLEILMNQGTEENRSRAKHAAELIRSCLQDDE